MFLGWRATGGVRTAGAAVSDLRTTFTALVPYVKRSSALVTGGHKFVVPTADQRSGMSPGSATDTVIPKGTRLYQIQPPGGRQGSWYTRKPVIPWKVGLSPVGTTTVREPGPGGAGLPPLQLPDGAGVVRQEGDVSTKLVRKSTHAFQTMTDVPAVRSIAAAIRDTWSMGAVDMGVMTSGGEEQLLISQISKVRPESEPEPKETTKHQFRASNRKPFPNLR
jgi:hypothetical protein